jgi:hypothetical protein
MSFPKREAEIEPHEGRYSLKITSGAKFVSATVHETEQKARDYAKKKNAKVTN